jgi:hypothetical protein
MRPRAGWIGLIVWMIAARVHAQTQASFASMPTTRPAGDLQSSPIAFTWDPLPGFAAVFPPPSTTSDVQTLMVSPVEPPSPYAPPEPEREDQGTNKGGVDVDFSFRYLTDDVYRGISHNRAVFVNQPGKPPEGSLHAANYQTEAKLSFNLGPFPHPFVGVFANIDDSDPLSRFQEIRPYAGIDYTIRPLIFSSGVNAYIYPERERFTPSPNTSEAFAKITLDDSYFFLTPGAILSPYIYGAYDYQANNGWYLEAGIKHDFDFQDFGVTISPYADVAYISRFRQQFIIVSRHASGFQHYDVGVTGDFSLNHLLKLAPRYGEFTIEGSLTYTSKFSNPEFANTELWGGVGLKYRY